MGLPASYRLARRSSDFGRFPTEGAVSAKEAGDRNAERRSLAEGARKPREIKTRYGKTGLNEEDN
jgi:branched-chain amino acid transport system substrate-binding protein